MFRPTTARSAFRLLPASNASVARSALQSNFLRAQLTTSSRYQAANHAQRLALITRKPASTALTRYLSTTSRFHDEKTEVQKRGKQPIEPEPAAVTSQSTIRHIAHEEGVPEEEPDVDMMAGIRADFNTIKETFTLREVPREALYVGLAGVVPYLATSASTAFLAWDINHAHQTGAGVFFSDQTAELLLHVIEPIQIGYGAVILSFLGAIHWGLEWAGYGGHQGYRRYAFGVLAPALAWPTLLMPIEYALISQFFTFTFLYYNDARAVVRGWSPPWYATYRFVLTFIVGASIVLSLIGRGQISDKITRLPGPAERMRALREQQLEELEAEEAKKKAAAYDGDEGEEE